MNEKMEYALLVEILNEAIGMAAAILKSEGQIEQADALRGQRAKVLSGKMPLPELQAFVAQCAGITKPFFEQHASKKQ